jgi:MarR family transcriptional regulator for hemolysin
MKENPELSRLDATIFYALEKAIKTYRQFAQRNIRQSGMEITIDQWLILKTIKDEPDLNQKEIATKVFKDHASITRIIELLVTRGFLQRSAHETDRRRYRLQLTTYGLDAYHQLVPIVSANRTTALQGLSDQEVKQLFRLLGSITENCN